ncbi:MAG: hypothetical protein WB053_06500 [Nitrososphaeraceae archaeon]
MSFFALLIKSTFAIQRQLAYAGGMSLSESGCDAADISDPSDRYINELEPEPCK